MEVSKRSSNIWIDTCQQQPVELATEKNGCRLTEWHCVAGKQNGEKENAMSSMFDSDQLVIGKAKMVVEIGALFLDMLIYKRVKSHDNCPFQKVLLTNCFKGPSIHFWLRVLR